jgi:hypothetical protein
MKISNAQLAKEAMKHILTQSFSKDVCKLITDRDVGCRDDLITKFFTYKMTVNVNVFCTFVKKRDW